MSVLFSHWVIPSIIFFTILSAFISSRLWRMMSLICNGRLIMCASRWYSKLSTTTWALSFLVRLKKPHLIGAWSVYIRNLEYREGSLLTSSRLGTLLWQLNFHLSAIGRRTTILRASLGTAIFDTANSALSHLWRWLSIHHLILFFTALIVSIILIFVLLLFFFFLLSFLLFIILLCTFLLWCFFLLLSTTTLTFFLGTWWWLLLFLKQRFLFILTLRLFSRASHRILWFLIISHKIRIEVISPTLEDLDHVFWQRCSSSSRTWWGLRTWPTA